MITSIEDWINFLRDSTSAGGIPLIIGGLGLMLFGWRMWKLCVIMSFGLIGAGIGASFTEGGADKWIAMIACGGVLAAVSAWPINYSVALLGGVLGGGMAYYYLDLLQVDGIMQWVITAAVVLSCSAFAFINKRRVVILVTAFIGAMLLVSGLTSWLIASPAIFGTFRSMASTCAIVLPFVLLVPTVMSCFYQMAEVRRLQIEL